MSVFVAEVQAPWNYRQAIDAQYSSRSLTGQAELPEHLIRPYLRPEGSEAAQHQDEPGEGEPADVHSGKLFFALPERKRHAERGALPELAIEGDVAAEYLDDFPAYRKPESHTRILGAEIRTEYLVV